MTYTIFIEQELVVIMDVGVKYTVISKIYCASLQYIFPDGEFMSVEAPTELTPLGTVAHEESQEYVFFLRGNFLRPLLYTCVFLQFISLQCFCPVFLW